MKYIYLFFIIGILSIVTATETQQPSTKVNKKKIGNLCGLALVKQTTTPPPDTSCASSTCHSGSGQYVSDATTMSALWNDALSTDNTKIHSDEILFGEKPKKDSGGNKEIAYNYKIGYQIHRFKIRPSDPNMEPIWYHCIVHISPHETDQAKILGAPSYCEDLGVGDQIGKLYIPIGDETTQSDTRIDPITGTSVKLKDLELAISYNLSKECVAGRMGLITFEDPDTPKPYHLYENSNDQFFKTNLSLPPEMRDSKFIIGEIKIMSKEPEVNNKIFTCFSLDFLVSTEFRYKYTMEPGHLPCFVRDDKVNNQTPNAMAQK